MEKLYEIFTVLLKKKQFVCKNLLTVCRYSEVKSFATVTFRPWGNSQVGHFDKTIALQDYHLNANMQLYWNRYLQHQIYPHGILSTKHYHYDV